MNNGHGQANGGTFNYWDQSYGGLDCVNCDNALLSGGTEDLTDGVITPFNWLDIENGAGTGP